MRKSLLFKSKKRPSLRNTRFCTSTWSILILRFRLLTANLYWNKPLTRRSLIFALTLKILHFLCVERMVLLKFEVALRIILRQLTKFNFLRTQKFERSFVSIISRFCWPLPRSMSSQFIKIIRRTALSSKSNPWSTVLKT